MGVISLFYRIREAILTFCGLFFLFFCLPINLGLSYNLLPSNKWKLSMNVIIKTKIDKFSERSLLHKVVLKLVGHLPRDSAHFFFSSTDKRHQLWV